VAHDQGVKGKAKVKLMAELVLSAGWLDCCKEGQAADILRLMPAVLHVNVTCERAAQKLLQQSILLCITQPYTQK
jgi:hypothetical protein